MVSSNQPTLPDVDACSSETFPALAGSVHSSHALAAETPDYSPIHSAGVSTNTFQIEKTLLSFTEWGTKASAVPQNKTFRQQFITALNKTASFGLLSYCFYMEFKFSIWQPKIKVHPRYSPRFWSSFSWESHVTRWFLCKLVKVQELQAELLCKAFMTHHCMSDEATVLIQCMTVNYFWAFECYRRSWTIERTCQTFRPKTLPCW